MEIRSLLDAFYSRPPRPRTYKETRQRSNGSRLGRERKILSVGGTGEVVMDAGSMEEGEPRSQPEDDWIDRATLCLPHFETDSILHGDDEGFGRVLRQYFPAAESNASEQLVHLKRRLRKASTHDFWAILMQEMCDITGAQCGFVAKRMLVDDKDSAVEMPQLGEEGSCLLGVAFYIDNGENVQELHRDYRYHAYGTPCAHMRHDKVFIVPERLAEFTPHNPNTLPWHRSEAFIGIPLFHDDKCFAHFGMIWSSEGASRRKLGWSFIEMFLHSLEDMILQRITEGQGFAKEVVTPSSTVAKVVPLEAITASQSLKPYARSLSHELRTPMQGVVGMLDIMYSTVLDAIANQPSDRIRSVFKELKSHIEVVQDSSRRAVEAADNVVHAYDLNLQMPETPLTPNESDGTRVFPSGMSSWGPSPTFESKLLSPPLSSSSTLSTRPNKKRERTEEFDFSSTQPSKRMLAMTEVDMFRGYFAHSIDDPIASLTTTIASTGKPALAGVPVEKDVRQLQHSPIIAPAAIGPAHRHVVVCDFVQELVNDAIRYIHPTSEIHVRTDLGEKIDVEAMGSRGEAHHRTIYLEIDSDVPNSIITEEQYLRFALTKLVDNAIKFTEQGAITVAVRTSKSFPVVEIWVADTGCGISETSKNNLFKPHFQQDGTIRRSRDGLGLSLFNAKAHVRKNLGGDVTLERSNTEGPLKGSEFLIRLPFLTLDCGNSDTPMVGTPPPSAILPCHLPPWVDTNQPSIPISTELLPTITAMPSRNASPKPSRKINPKLAQQYPLNILIAEDNAINRNVAIGSLMKLGYSRDNITLAYDGNQAVNEYKRSLDGKPSQRFDAILMDIWMPNMDGYQATRTIMDLARQNGETPTIVAVTADITEESSEKAKRAGMAGFLAKPYKVMDIERLVVEHFPRCY